VGSTRCFRLTPVALSTRGRDRLLVHLHDGNYVLGAGEAGTFEAALLAHHCRTSVISVDYRTAPEHPFPAALDDSVSVWKALVRDFQPGAIALGGAASGGGLAMATVHRLEQAGLPLPGALILGSPASDLTKTGDSYYSNCDVDGELPSYEGAYGLMLRLYAGNHDLQDPLLSPLYGDLGGFPPTILISGTRDLLLSNTVRTHRKLRQAGVEADLHVYEGQSHHQYTRSFPSPEAADAMREIARFVDRRLGHGARDWS
jgi:monoterpene epsilon-lactone hydrolase